MISTLAAKQPTPSSRFAIVPEGAQRDNQAGAFQRWQILERPRGLVFSRGESVSSDGARFPCAPPGSASESGLGGATLALVPADPKQAPPRSTAALFEAVRIRHSVRTYDGVPLRAEHLAAIQAYLADPERMTGPLGWEFRIELLTDVPEDREIGTYGYTKGFKAVLLAIARLEPLALFEMAYVLHGLVLELTHLGVGTIWMGGAFNPADVERSVRLGRGEIIAAIVPLGYASQKKRLIDVAAPLVLKLKFEPQN